MNSWSNFFDNRKKIWLFLGLFLLALLVTILFSKFLMWNESRVGKNFDDPILGRFQPVDLSLWIGILTNGAIFAGLITLFRKPTTTIYLLSTVLLMCIIRGLSLYFVVLEPPTNIIPLKDPILELTFYGGQVLLKDLFFSGHTANIILVGLLSENIWMKRSIVLLGFIVGFMLVLQHVHYSIDVLAAPIFAIITYKLSIKLGNFLMLQHIETGKRCGSLVYELGLKPSRK
ncbi:MAG: sphingomyelin synthase family protein [Chitinophagales bacterium]|nr:sphingomyelin synthase family protein [Chitinophagales bacterium]